LLLLYCGLEKQDTCSLADPSLSRDPLSSLTADNGGKEGDPTSRYELLLNPDELFFAPILF
jgi:hypothetical protein